MPVIPLYHICFNYIKDHTEDITSLEGVPFHPTVENLLEHLFKSDIPLQSSILSVIADSHSKELREADLPWTRVSLTGIIRPPAPALKAVSRHFPRFITCLDAELSFLCDDDIRLLGGLSNLKSLRLGRNPNITDRGISYIANVATSALPLGMPFLGDLHLNNLPYVTDKSLKYIGQLSTLTYIDISDTDIIKEVALKYLPTKGFKQVPRRANPFELEFVAAPGTSLEDKRSETNVVFHCLIKEIATKYESGDYANTYIPFREDNSGRTSTQSTLCFSRLNDTRLLTKAKKRSAEPMSSNRRRLTIRNQKLTTDDFLAMFENEMANDD
jgi:hypothetical protein